MKQLFAISALGVKHHKRSFTIKNFVGWTHQVSKADAETFTIQQWKRLNPKLKLEQINVMQVPTAALFSITSQHALKAPEFIA
jgi:hypothetical protein